MFAQTLEIRIRCISTFSMNTCNVLFDGFTVAQLIFDDPTHDVIVIVELWLDAQPIVRARI